MKYVILLLMIFFPIHCHANSDFDNELKFWKGERFNIYINVDSVYVNEEPNGDIFIYCEIYHESTDEFFNKVNYYRPLNFYLTTKNGKKIMGFWNFREQRYYPLSNYKEVEYVIPYDTEAQFMYMPICNFLYYVKYDEWYFEFDDDLFPSRAYRDF